ncbi:glycosyltransferase family 9 protein [Candidatus Sumerlaeota bacterium]|nr:glycosyltransferase family 9 protein [Candidatus Sumerlaeota bacterium]
MSRWTFNGGALPESAKTALIVKYAAAGDVLRTASILPGLRKRWPELRVTWVTLPGAYALLRRHPMIDELLLADDAEAAGVLEREFDLLLNFEKETEACLLANRARANCKKGFCLTPFNTLAAFDADSNDALQLGLDDELKFRLNRKTYPEIIYEMAGLEYASEMYVMRLGDEERAARERLLERHPRKPGEVWIGVHTGCGPVFATKQWTLDGFVDVFHHFQDRDNVRLVLFGGEREREFNRSLIEHAGHARVIDTGCDNSLAEFVGMVDACDVLLSGDTLALHVGVALGKRVVTFIGPTSASELDLFGRGEQLVTDFSCAPCYKKQCPLDVSCMQALPASTVIAALERQLNATREESDAMDAKP